MLAVLSAMRLGELLGTAGTIGEGTGETESRMCGCAEMLLLLSGLSKSGGAVVGEADRHGVESRETLGSSLLCRAT